MTLFEYLAIAFGLIFTLAAMRLIGGLPHALRPGSRYGVHVTMVALMLVGGTANFWTFWSLQLVAWTFPKFLLALTIPGALYYCCAVLIPENPEDVTSWRDHYWRTRVRFYSGMMAWMLAAVVSATVNLGMGLRHPARAFHACMLIFALVGVFSDSERLHRGLAIALTTAGALLMFTVAARPGWLAG